MLETILKLFVARRDALIFSLWVATYDEHKKISIEGEIQGLNYCIETITCAIENEKGREEK